jgi:ParB family transcriptional regulator, chromosome partitioning protein
MTKKPKLGKGLDALLGGIEKIEKEQKQPNENELLHLGIEQIVPGKYQPRSNFNKEALQKLAMSLQKSGMIQPVVVRPCGQKYEIIAGERRWRAAAIAKIDSIPVIVKTINDKMAAAISLIENIQREDLNVIEEATSFARFVKDFKMTHEQIAKLLTRTRSSVTNSLRLLELTPLVKDYLITKKLDMGHARALLVLDNVTQMKLANKIVKNKLNVRQTESLVNSYKYTDTKNKEEIQKDNDIKRLEQSITEKLSAPVSILHNKSGKGRLVINYHSIDELDGIIKRIK